MTDRLSRLNPSAAGLDRDALLFAAGQRSARSSWLWPLVAGVLAIAQVGTLVTLWPRDAAGPPNIVAPPAYSPTFEFPPASPPPDVWSAGSRPDVLQSTTPPARSEFVTSGPPLTVGSSRLFD